MTQSVEARQKRVAYVLEKCVQTARRKSGLPPADDPIDPIDFD